MIELRNVFLLTRKEVRDALRNRWLFLYAVVFAVMAWSLSWMGLSAIEQYGVSSFGRTSISLINLVVLIVPLMGISAGALSLAFEREKGVLTYTLSQPVTIGEVLLGKFFGLGCALLIALLIGFGISGGLIAWKTGMTQVGAYLSLLGLSFALALISLGLGLFVSAAVRRASLSIGLAVLLWTLLVFFGDLGIMGTALIMKLNVHDLLFVSLANPIQVFKTAAILMADGNLDVLGPAGQYAIRNYGTQLLPVLLALLVGWILIPLTATYGVFRWKGAI